jgi:hypothetical protein
MKKGVFALLATYVVFEVLSRWSFFAGLMMGLAIGGLIGYVVG